MLVAKRRSGPLLTTLAIRGFAFNPLLTHKGEDRCNMLTGALVPRWGTVAGVPGPRRSADERDAGWFAPVATRRRPFVYKYRVSGCRQQWHLQHLRSEISSRVALRFGL